MGKNIVHLPPGQDFSAEHFGSESMRDFGFGASGQTAPRTKAGQSAPASTKSKSFAKGGRADMHTSMGAPHIQPHADGSHTVHHPDGRRTHHAEDGSFTRYHPDGAVEHFDAKGGHIMHNMDGTSMVHHEDGAVTHHHPDGSTEHHVPGFADGGPAMAPTMGPRPGQMGMNEGNRLGVANHMMPGEHPMAPGALQAGPANVHVEPTAVRAMKHGGHVADGDEAQDKAMVAKGIHQHENHEHHGEHTDLHLRHGGQVAGMKKPRSHRGGPAMNTPPMNPDTTPTPKNMGRPGGQAPYGVQPSDEPGHTDTDDNAGSGVTQMRRGGHVGYSRGGKANC